MRFHDHLSDLARDSLIAISGHSIYGKKKADNSVTATLLTALASIIRPLPAPSSCCQAPVGQTDLADAAYSKIIGAQPDVVERRPTFCCPCIFLQAVRPGRQKATQAAYFPGSC